MEFAENFADLCQRVNDLSRETATTAADAAAADKDDATSVGSYIDVTGDAEASASIVSSPGASQSLFGRLLGPVHSILFSTFHTVTATREKDGTDQLQQQDEISDSILQSQARAVTRHSVR